MNLSQYLETLKVSLPSGYPDFALSNIHNPTTNGSSLTFDADVTVSNIHFPAPLFGVLNDMLPKDCTAPSTITVNTGGVKPTDAFLLVSFKTDKVNLNAGSGLSLTLNNPTVNLSVSPLSSPPSAKFQVLATLPVTLFNNQTLPANVNMAVSVSPSGMASAEAGLDINAPQGIDLPPILDDILTLKNIGGELGVIFDPPGCLVGITAEGALKGMNMPTSSFTIVCDVEGDVPVPLYISFGASSVDFNNFIQLCGLPGLVNTGLGFELENPSFTWCQKSVTLPNGQPGKPGFSVESYVSIIGYKFFGDMQIVKGKSYSGKYQADPINIAEVFSLTSDGDIPAIQRKQVPNGAIPKSAEDNKSTENAPMQTMVSANGPSFDISLSTQNIPQGTINGKAQFLDLPAQSINAKVGEEGITIDFDFGTLAQVDTAFTLNSNGLRGAISFEPKSPIPMPKEIGDLTSANKISAQITCMQYSFEAGIHIVFLGEDIDMGVAVLNGSTSVESVIQAIIQYIIDNPMPLIMALMNNPVGYLKAITSKLITPVENTAEGLLNGLNSIGVPSAGLKASLQYMEGTMGYSADVIAKGLQTSYQMDPSNIGIALGQLGLNANQVATIMLNDLKVPFMAVPAVFNAMHIGVKDATTALEDVYHIGDPKELGILLQTGGYAKDDIVSAFKEIGGDFASVAEKVWNDADPKNW
ncbi:hypothetical protein [Roseivirga sp.]|uniref:hypothetical protein n=1 Tax=Roseivirga sp. TaxID=1964215 RepID=UPI003B5286AD